MRNAIAPSRTNGCYGWLIWVNAGAPCIGPTIGERPVEDGRDFPDLPADMYQFSGLFGQRVTLFPSQGIVLVRTGQDPSLVFAGSASWERELYTRVLAAVTDQWIERPGDPPKSDGAGRPEADYGFQTSLREPDQYSQGVVQEPLPPAGPRRARAAQLRQARRRASRKGTVSIRLWCPLRWPGPAGDGCNGTASLTGARKPVSYALNAGSAQTIHLLLTERRLRTLIRRGSMRLAVQAVNSDQAGGVPAALAVTVKRPLHRRGTSPRALPARG
jgi:hypothetical protein